MMSALVLAAALLAQAGGPHFSEDPDAVSTPGATQAAPATPPTAVAAPVRIVASPAQEIAAEENREDPISCQTYEVTGTRFTTKHCLRKSQWDQMARDSKDQYQSWTNTNAITH
jgi:hypothetical protein